MGLFCMRCWGVDGSWRMIPRMSRLHTQLFTHLQQWVVVWVYSVTLNNIYSWFLPTVFMHVYVVVVDSCLHTQWLSSLQSGGSNSKWLSLVTLSVRNALCSWSGRQQNGGLLEAGTVSGAALIFPSWTLHVCHACKDVACWRPTSHCSWVSLICLQAMLKTWYRSIHFTHNWPHTESCFVV